MQLSNTTPSATVARKMAEPLVGFEFALSQTNRILTRLARIDLRSFETLAAITGVHAMIRGPIAETLTVLIDAMRLISTLPCLVTDKAIPDTTEAGDDFDLQLEDYSQANRVEPFEGDAHPAAMERFCEEVDSALSRLTTVPRSLVGAEALTGLCQMLTGGLRQARSQLLTARNQRSKWGIIATAEEARRKTQRALRAAMCTAARLVDIPPDDLPFSADQSELASALRVREMLMTFRRDVLHVTAATAELSQAEVRLVATKAIQCIAALRQTSAYHELRALDRFNLEKLRANLKHWLSDTCAHPDVGRHALLDLNAYAELLASINHRETLVQHDRLVKHQAAEELEACLAMVGVQHPSAALSYRTALQRLQAMKWRSEELDRHVQSEMERGDNAALDKRVFSTLTVLAAVHI